MEDIILIDETRKLLIEEVYDWIKNYAWEDENGKVDYSTFKYDFFKEFRKYM